MSDEKKKVKDLATELNQPAKDVIAAAKELGIVAAKATTSSLSEAETARIRNHFAPAADKPEVIVRRRKKVDAPATDDAPAEGFVKVAKVIRGDGHGGHHTIIFDTRHCERSNSHSIAPSF